MALSTNSFDASKADHTIGRAEALRRAMLALINGGGPTRTPRRGHRYGFRGRRGRKMI